MQDSINIFISSLGWALLHSFWQGLLLYGILYLTFKVKRDLPSHVKYNLSLFTLAACFIWFAETWVKCANNMQRLATTEATVYNTQFVTRSVNAHVQPIATPSSLADLERYLPFIVFIYLVGVMIMLGRLGFNFLQIRKLKRRGIVIPSPEWITKMESISQRLQIKQKVKLLFSDYINVPLVVGAFKPVILIPLATVNNLGTDEMEAILIHELAHIRRYDYFVNMLQVLVETILFFNPFIWIISKIIRREREHSCDDIVIGYTAQPLPYAKALATLESLRQTQLAMAASGNKNQLFNRIKRIMEMKKNSNYNPFLLTFALGGLFLCVFLLSPGFAQSKKEKAGKQQTTSTVMKQKVIVIDDNGKKHVYNSTKEMSAADKEKLTDAPDLEVISDADSATIAEALETVKDAMDSIDWKAISKATTAATKVATEASGEALKQSKKIIIKTAKDMHGANRKELEKAMMELEKAEKELKGIDWESINKEVEDALREAQLTSAEAKAGKKKLILTNGHGGSYDEMLDKMQSDGLIDREKGFTIEKKNDELYVDGNLQPDAIYRKYKKYLDGDKISIAGSKDNLAIKVNK